MNCVSKLLIKLGLLMSLRSPSEKALGAVEIAKEMFDAPGSGKARLLLYGENCDGKTFSLFGTVIPQQVISPLTLAIYGCGLAISDGQLVFGRSGGVPTKQ